MNHSVVGPPSTAVNVTVSPTQISESDTVIPEISTVPVVTLIVTSLEQYPTSALIVTEPV
ncbi:hypothetical protein GCM10009118_32830 [Wandonia haliotis]|uniref:Zinc finger protein n=1 Tax=Wandonia haliotis TaxID=574963 RepID=A0ABN1MV79_9FLAO